MTIRQFFTRERFYQIGIAMFAILALSIWIAKSFSDRDLREQAETKATEHAAAISSLIGAHDKALDARAKQVLGIVATALSGLPTPAAEDGANPYYATLDSLVRHDGVTLAVVALVDSTILASSDRHFEGKALSKAFPERPTAAATEIGLQEADFGWTVTAPLGGKDPAAVVLLRYSRSSK